LQIGAGVAIEQNGHDFSQAKARLGATHVSQTSSSLDSLGATTTLGSNWATGETTLNHSQGHGHTEPRGQLEVLEPVTPWEAVGSRTRTASHRPTSLKWSQVEKEGQLPTIYVNGSRDATPEQSTHSLGAGTTHRPCRPHSRGLLVEDLQNYVLRGRRPSALSSVSSDDGATSPEISSFSCADRPKPPPDNAPPTGKHFRRRAVIDDSAARPLAVSHIDPKWGMTTRP